MPWKFCTMGQHIAGEVQRPYVRPIGVVLLEVRRTHIFELLGEGRDSVVDLFFLLFILFVHQAVGDFHEVCQRVEGEGEGAEDDAIGQGQLQGVGFFVWHQADRASDFCLGGLDGTLAKDVTRQAPDFVFGHVLAVEREEDGVRLGHLEDGTDLQRRADLASFGIHHACVDCYGCPWVRSSGHIGHLTLVRMCTTPKNSVNKMISFY